MHSFMVTMAITGHPGSAAFLYALTVLLSAVVELAHSAAAQIIFTSWRSDKRKHRK
jgi:hypothetical protein